MFYRTLVNMYYETKNIKSIEYDFYVKGFNVLLKLMLSKCLTPKL